MGRWCLMKFRAGCDCVCSLVLDQGSQFLGLFVHFQSGWGNDRACSPLALRSHRQVNRLKSEAISHHEVPYPPPWGYRPSGLSEANHMPQTR